MAILKESFISVCYFITSLAVSDSIKLVVKRVCLQIPTALPGIASRQFDLYILQLQIGGFFPPDHTIFFKQLKKYISCQFSPPNKIKGLSRPINCLASQAVKALVQITVPAKQWLAFVCFNLVHSIGIGLYFPPSLTATQR